MFPIWHLDYCPTLRGKPGELLALDRLFAPIKDKIGPVIVLPSLGSKDLQKRRVLSPREAARLHIGRIADAWKQRVFFLDTRFLRFDPDQEKDAKHLKALFDLTMQFDCKAIPVVDLRTGEKRLQAVRNYVENTGSGIAFRASMSDFESRNLDERLRQLIAATGTSYDSTVLQLDFGDATIVERKAFAQLLLHTFSHFAEIGPWARVITSASNYPNRNPANPNSSTTVPRLEWTAWQDAAKTDDRIKASIFGDFGADNGKIEFLDSSGQPVVHLRYAVSDSWLISRGGPSSDSVDGSIRFVAARIVNSKFFAGEKFSWGDQFIADCASGAGGAGYPTIWRGVNMNRHMSRALTDVGTFIGHVIEESTARFSPVQQLLPL